MDKTGDVLSHICAVMSSLSPSEKAIATYVLDHPSDVATMTVRELAAETGTSPASVSRFARTLDYRTYSDMRLALGISISRASGEEKATGGKVTLDDIEGSIKYVLSHKVKELSQTASLIDSDDFSTVVNLLHNANLVLIAGVAGDKVGQRQVGVCEALQKHPAHFVVFFIGVGVCRNGKAQHRVVRPDGPQVCHKVVAGIQHRDVWSRLKGAAAGAAGQKQCHNGSS